MLKRIRRFFNRNMNEKEINYKEAIKLKNSIFIDVRSHQEYEEEHLNGAISISLYDLEKEIEKYIPNKNQLLVVYCTTGTRSKEAQTILENLGYNNVYNLQGGLDNI